jgi:hypothetical protein
MYVMHHRDTTTCQDNVQTQALNQLYKEGKNTERASKDGNLPQLPLIEEARRHEP